MNPAFTAGFEKLSYDYARETDDLADSYKRRSKMTPIGMKQTALLGAGIGAGLGGLYGGLRSSGSRVSGALLGLLAGGAAGGAAGALTAMSDKLGIERAKEIMAMPPKKRRELLQSMARKSEISEREANEWSRTQALASAMTPRTVVVSGASDHNPSPVPTFKQCTHCGAPAHAVHKTSLGWACDYCDNLR